MKLFKKKFLLRREVLKTYKQLIKSVKLIEDEGYRRELTNWVRSDFKFNKGIKDEVNYIKKVKLFYKNTLNINSRLV